MKHTTLKSDGFIRTGLRHLGRDQPCQDYILAMQTRGRGTDLFIDCDGISCCENAEAGSKIVAHAIGDYFVHKAADKAFMKELLSSPESMTAQIALELDVCNKTALKDIPKADTTMTFVWVISGRYALAGCLGDSAVCIFSDKSATVMTQTRDYGGATESARVSRAENMDIRLINLKEERVKGFLLTSDGMEGLLYTKGKRARAMHLCEEFVNTLFEEDGHAQIERYLDRACSEGGYDDDISLIIAAFEPIAVEDDPTWLCTCGSRNGLFVTRCEQCGKDYLSLYRKVDMLGYPSVWEYFQYLNAHPDEEHTVIATREQPDRQRIDRHIADVGEERVEDDFIEYHDDYYDEDSSAGFKRSVPVRKTSPSCKRQTRRIRRDGSSRFFKHVAVAGSMIAVLLCSVLVVNFFQILSISNTLSEMRAEIDSIKEEAVVYGTKELPRESTAHNADKATYPPTPGPSQAPTRLVGLMVSEAVALYPEPNYHTGAVSTALPSSDIVLLSHKTVEGTRWVQVQLANGDIGWAPYAFFSEISVSEESDGAEESTEEYR